MAEFCLTCFNRLNHTRHAERDVLLSERPTLCEDCGERKTIVVGFSFQRKMKDLLRRVFWG